MAIIVPEDYHARKALEARRVHCITQDQSQKQDIRPLRIGILNIMPQAETYEYNLLYPLGRSVLQIEPVWLRLKSHNYLSSNQEHLKKLYIDFDQAIAEKGFDGLILTGAPVEEIPFEKVNYWDELSSILAYAHENIASTLGLCWGGLAMARYLGIDKMIFDQKLFGVYPLKNLNHSHAVTGELDDEFWCPQSRHAGIPDEVMEAAEQEKRLNLLAHSKKTGYTIFESTNERFLMHLGHPEYQTHRLIEEFERDRKRGRYDVDPPENIDLSEPINRWRSHRLEFFLQWVKKVYLDTPYHI